MPGLVVPTNQVMAQGTAERFEMKVGANATPAKMLPGTLVILDTTLNEVKEAGAKAHGILGIIDVDHEHTIGDPYDNGDASVGDNVPIIVPHSGSIVSLMFLANENFAQGDALVSAADGKVAEVAVAALGSQGDIIGNAWCTEAGAADKRVLVRWNYCPEGAAVA